MCANCDKPMKRNSIKCKNCSEFCIYCGDYGHFVNKCRLKGK